MREVIAISIKNRLICEIVIGIMVLVCFGAFISGGVLLDLCIDEFNTLFLVVSIILLIIGILLFGAMFILSTRRDMGKFQKKLIIRNEDELILEKNEKIHIGEITNITYEAERAKSSSKSWGTLTFFCGETTYRIANVAKIMKVYYRLQELIEESKKENPNYKKETENG